MEGLKLQQQKIRVWEITLFLDKCGLQQVAKKPVKPSATARATATATATDIATATAKQILAANALIIGCG